MIQKEMVNFKIDKQNKNKNKTQDNLPMSIEQLRVKEYIDGSL